VYVDAHLLRGQEHFVKGRYDEALKDFEAALEYPANLEVGRPARGGRSSQVHYYIGAAHEALGNVKKARESYEQSVAEQHGWSETRYCQGLSYRKLGREQEAGEMFEGLIRFGQDRLSASSGMDFFAKFGEKQSEMRQRAHAHYLFGLGYLGKRDDRRAREAFEQVLNANPNHIWARFNLARLKGN
jgi:tetratricopeptide (TPR) repeat protein